MHRALSRGRVAINSNFSRFQSIVLVLLLFVSNVVAVFAEPFGVARKNTTATNQTVPTTLEPGVLLERELAGREVHLFSIQLPAAQFVRISVYQRGSVLNTKLFAPNSTKLLEGTTPNALSDVSRFSFISESAGEYRLEIAHVRRETPRRQYAIKVEEQRVAKPGDQERSIADRLVMEAGSLIAAMSADNLKAATEKYQNALSLFRQVGARYETAQTLLSIGSISNNLSQKNVAIDYYSQALPIWRELKDRRKEAQTLSALGWAYFGAGDFTNALTNYNQALPIRQELNDLIGQAQTHTTLGQVHSSLGESQLAIENYTQGLKLAREVGDKVQQAFALNNFGYMYGNLGEYQKALDCLNEAVVLWKETGNRYGEADAINSTGIIYDRLGDFERSVDYYNQALKIWRHLGYRGGEADALNNIGVTIVNQVMIYGRLENLNTSLDYLNQALKIRRDIGQGLGEESTLLSLAVVYQYLDQTTKSFECLNEVLAKHPNHPLALHNIGFNYFRLGDFPHAMEYLKRALIIETERGNREAESLTLRLLAATQTELGQFIEARDNALKALEIVESARAPVVVQEVRMLHRGATLSFLITLIKIFSELHKLHPTEGYDVKAFEISERERARGLLEMLLQARVDLSKDVEPVALTLEHSLQMQLNAKDQYRARLVGVKGRESELAATEKEIRLLEIQYQEARASLMRANPKYAALTQPKILNIREMQSLIDKDTLLLEYRLGDEKSFLWAISNNSVIMEVLPPGGAVNAQARRVYDLLTVRNIHQPGETAPQKAARVAKADADYAEAASTLSQTVLGPIAASLGKKRLVVISESWLQYIPFGALPTPLTKLQASKASSLAQPLMIDHEIVNLPSVSVLEVLRRETGKRQNHENTVAVIADPVYSNDDPRIKTPVLNTAVSSKMTRDQATGNGRDVGAASNQAETLRYGRLRFSRDEAQTIASFAPGKSTFAALDFDASKKTVVNSDLSQFRILHFATHGVLDTQRPERSGLALSFVDENGETLDGYLRLNDIYKLRLNADLVVLSGCQTGLGKDLKGEGLIGLTRGFMYAGVPRVIASLWNVDDRATSELMKRFYRGFLVQDLPAAAALREAQKSMFLERGWSSPYYWASFTIQGEWK